VEVRIPANSSTDSDPILKVADLFQNRWPIYIGFTGRFAPDYAGSGFQPNTGQCDSDNRSRFALRSGLITSASGGDINHNCYMT
jgi:hypothetical protein